MSIFSRLSGFQRKMLLLVIAVLVLAAGALYWFVSQGQRSTDDAYVGAKVAQVSSLVMGPHDASAISSGAAARTARRPSFA